VSLIEPGKVHANLEVSAPASFRVLFMDPSTMKKAATELDVNGTVHFRLSQIDSVSHPKVRRAFLALHASLEQPATPLERESRFTSCMQLCRFSERRDIAPAGFGLPIAELHGDQTR